MIYKLKNGSHLMVFLNVISYILLVIESKMQEPKSILQIWWQSSLTWQEHKVVSHLSSRSQ